jgi:excisionase family DNA binding protein
MAKRTKPTRQTRATFFWDNPPGPRSGGSLVRTLGGREYERQVGPNDVLDVHEAAAALGNLHIYSVYRLIWEGRLPVVRKGRNVLIRLRAIKRYRAETPRSRAVKGGGQVWFAG